MRDYNKQKYLKLLSKEYKNINRSIRRNNKPKSNINLPKGTEVFLSDIHGRICTIYTYFDKVQE